MGSHTWSIIALSQLGHYLLKDVVSFGTQDFTQIGLIFFLVLLSGLFSGLNLGLMSLDQLSLEIVIGSGTAKEAKFAKRIYPIRKRGNLLLCTILLGNVSVNTLLSILMASFTSGTFGFLASTFIIVVFGEIIPQAFCARHSLSIGYYSVWIVWIFLIILLPISYPISKLLDFTLGRELGTIYTRDELKKLLDIHSTYSDITKEETSILSGALDFSSKTVEQVMTSIDDVFMIDIDEELNSQTIKKLLEMGYSRIPVYERRKDNIVNLFYLKDLALINPDNCFKVRDIIHIIGRKLPKVSIDTKLSEMLTIFKSGRSHICVVRRYANSHKKQSSANNKKDNNNNHHSKHIEEEEEVTEIELEEDLENPRNYINVGIVTLEDIMEEILQSEINDETDLHLDNRTMIKLNNKGRNKEVNYSLIEATEEEEEVADKIFATLRKYSEFSEDISPPVLQSLISQSAITKIKKDEVIYEWDGVYDYCVVLVQGALQLNAKKQSKSSIGSGKEETYTVSPREKEGFCIGLPALLTEDDDENWVSDINAFAKEDSVIVKISKRAYFAALQATQFQSEDFNNDDEDNF